jgi:hypothetical protein
MSRSFPGSWKRSVVALGSRSSILVLLAALALVACDSARRKLDLPREQVAEVHGLREPVVFGTARLLSFLGVDGDDFPLGILSPTPMEIDVTAGKHSLKCHYSVSVDETLVALGTKEVELDAKAAMIYQGHLELGQHGEPVITFVEISREEIEGARRKNDRAARTAGTGG